MKLNFNPVVMFPRIRQGLDSNPKLPHRCRGCNTSNALSILTAYADLPFAESPNSDPLFGDHRDRHGVRCHARLLIQLLRLGN